MVDPRLIGALSSLEIGQDFTYRPVRSALEDTTVVRCYANIDLYFNEKYRFARVFTQRANLDKYNKAKLKADFKCLLSNFQIFLVSFFSLTLFTM